METTDIRPDEPAETADGTAWEAEPAADSLKAPRGSEAPAGQEAPAPAETADGTALESPAGPAGDPAPAGAPAGEEAPAPAETADGTAPESLAGPAGDPAPAAEARREEAPAPDAAEPQDAPGTADGDARAFAPPEEHGRQPEAAGATNDGSVASATDSIDSEQLLFEEGRPAPEDDADLRAMLEGIVYITEEPLSAQQIALALERPAEKIQALLAELQTEYEKPRHGLTIREVAGGYKMATKPEHHEAIRAFVKKLTPPLKLSLAALETLSVIAYKQPITAPEIMEIRGVQGAGVLKTLLDRKLITTAGRKQVIGKPILYRTTKEFLVQFGLKDLSELPSLKEFEELKRLSVSDEPAPETAETEAAAPAPGGIAAHAAGEPESDTPSTRGEAEPAEPEAGTRGAGDKGAETGELPAEELPCRTPAAAAGSDRAAQDPERFVPAGSSFPGEPSGTAGTDDAGVPEAGGQGAAGGNPDGPPPGGGDAAARTESETRRPAPAPEAPRES